MKKEGRIIVLNWYTCFTIFRGRPGKNIKKGIFQLFEHEQKTNKNAGQKNCEEIWRDKNNRNRKF